MEEKRVNKTTFEEKIRPVLEAYRAKVELVEVTADGFLKVRITGDCVSCNDAEEIILELVETTFKEVICLDIKGIILVEKVRRTRMGNAVKFLHKDVAKRCRYAIAR
jgi:Fe-S cluster biogenesis protein NfuA